VTAPSWTFSTNGVPASRSSVAGNRVASHYQSPPSTTKIRTRPPASRNGRRTCQPTAHPGRRSKSA